MVAVNKNRLWKIKQIFAKNVASMHREEIFGIKNCGGISWDCLYKDFLIIEALECHTGKVLNNTDINCLTSKITKKCNC